MSSQLYINDIHVLFDDVQCAQIFEDQKTMTDAVPLFPIVEINRKYDDGKYDKNFDLKAFVLDNFGFINKKTIQREVLLPIEEHIEKLWDELTYSAPKDEGTLLKLPKPYIVPGGRFNEFFYWDSYFVMLGLQVSGRLEMMQNIVENCSYLISTYGFVPNASRTHFLSRSQPPYFSLMLELLIESTEDEQGMYSKYYDTLEKEYSFWMDGEENLVNGAAQKRVVKTKDGTLLNRYYDSQNLPRPESYLIDIEDQKSTHQEEFYRNIRSACESGWDFSSRWFEDEEHIQTIETQNISEVDLNCLLWHLEKTLAKSANLLGLGEETCYYDEKARVRKQAINDYFWDEEAGIYKDYHIKNCKKTVSYHIASLYPLFLGLANENQAQAMSETIAEKFLHSGGLITTTKNTGQQWDMPNAWAPYQWLGFKGFKQYGFTQLADDIRNNWCKNVERVYHNTGKLMEKYNAIDTGTIAGGGEYPNQDGFGWTNGVYIRLKNHN